MPMGRKQAEDSVVHKKAIWGQVVGAEGDQESATTTFATWPKMAIPDTCTSVYASGMAIPRWSNSQLECFTPTAPPLQAHLCRLAGQTRGDVKVTARPL